MREIQTEIEISASPDTVWSVLTDIDNWKEWSPIFVNSSGTPSKASKLSITMIGQGDSDGPKYEPTITAIENQNILDGALK